jgi:hypothetical protein
MRRNRLAPTDRIVPDSTKIARFWPGGASAITRPQRAPPTGARGIPRLAPKNLSAFADVLPFLTRRTESLDAQLSVFADIFPAWAIGTRDFADTFHARKVGNPAGTGALSLSVTMSCMSLLTPVLKPLRAARDRSSPDAATRKGPSRSCRADTHRGFGPRRLSSWKRLRSPRQPRLSRP